MLAAKVAAGPLAGLAATASSGDTLPASVVGQVAPQDLTDLLDMGSVAMTVDRSQQVADLRRCPVRRELTLQLVVCDPGLPALTNLVAELAESVQDY